MLQITVLIIGIFMIVWGMRGATKGLPIPKEPPIPPLIENLFLGVNLVLVGIAITFWSEHIISSFKIFPPLIIGAVPYIIILALLVIERIHRLAHEIRRKKVNG